MSGRLGELLVRENLISLQQLQKAQEEQRKTGGRIGSLLVKQGAIADHDLTSFLSKQYGVPAISLKDFDIDDEVLKLIPKATAEKHQVIPVNRAGSSLIIAMSDPSNIFAIDDIKFLTGYNVEPVVASEQAIKEAIEKYYAEKGPDLDEVMSGFDDSEVAVIEAEGDDMNVVDLEKSAEEAPVVKLVNLILLDAIKKGASDIHVEPYEKDFRVRFRIDGVLYEVMKPPMKLRNAIISRLKIMSELDISERRLAEEALRESHERFRQLAEHIREVFWLTDPEKMNMIYISPGYEDIWGRSCTSLYDSPQSWLDAIHPDDQPRIRQAMLTQQLTGTYDVEYRIIRPDGTIRWIWDRAFPVRDQTGQVYRIAGIAEDITQRKGNDTSSPTRVADLTQPLLLLRDLAQLDLQFRQLQHSVLLHLLEPVIADLELLDAGFALAVHGFQLVQPLLGFVLLLHRLGDLRLDRLDVLGLLGHRVRVVEAEVGPAAEGAGEAEVEEDRLRVADVQEAVRLRREAGHDLAAALARGDVGRDDVGEEVLRARGVGHAADGGIPAARRPQPCARALVSRLRRAGAGRGSRRADRPPRLESRPSPAPDPATGERTR